MRGIYIFKNKITNEVYVGQSTNIESRYNTHKSRTNNKNCKKYKSKFYDAVAIYGWDNFEFQVLEENINFTKEKLDELEKYYIQKYDSYWHGYNSTFGEQGEMTICRTMTKEKLNGIITELKSLDKSIKDISQAYNISESMIYGINRGDFWWQENISYPIREILLPSERNKGEKNGRAKSSEQTVMEIRKKYMYMTVPQLMEQYPDYSYSGLRKILFGDSYSYLPYYSKRKKSWMLNGNCIDYSELDLK